MYRKVAAIPQKITVRYSRISPRISRGTCKNAMMPSMPANASRFNAAVNTKIRAKEAHIPSFRRSSSRWPKRMENTAPLPMQSPSKMEVRKVIRAKADPTAASAPAPRNRPTISVSATL